VHEAGDGTTRVLGAGDEEIPAERSIALAHGGTVTAVPGPEAGLAVTVRLSVDQSSATNPRAAAQAGSPASTSR
jgi:hypothetical protein